MERFERAFAMTWLLPLALVFVVVVRIGSGRWPSALG